MIGRALFTSAALGAAALTLAGCADDDRRVLPLQFQVRVENVSDASATPTALAPGVWVVTTDTAPLFDVGARDRGEGLEALAEDGDPSALATTLGLLPAARSGAFDTPVGAGAPGPIGPGEAYEFTVDAYEADGNLNLATMVVESNDLFLSPAAAAGVDLFVPSLASIGGTLDVSASFAVWDAGTEANQATAAGGDQAPRQASANTGAAEGVVAAFAGSTRALPPADGSSTSP